MTNPLSKDEIVKTIREISETGDKDADISFARLFYKHGNGTKEAKEYALAYFTERDPRGHVPQ